MSFNKRVPIFLKLGFNEEQIPILKEYVDLLWDANEELNLISRKMTMDDLIDNHLIDCLLPLSHFPKNIQTVADFGTGGGLPGVVYAIQFPEIKFHLYEKSKLKQKFLEHCKKHLAPNLEIQGEITPKIKEADLVISRAFKPIDVLLDMSRDYYIKGGKYFLLKARKDKIEEELRDAKKSFKNMAAKILELKSPVLEVERHLVLIND